MKTKLTLMGSLVTLGAVASLHAQTAVTAPVGYRTQTIAPGVFNLISPNFSNAVSAAGDVDAVGAVTLTDGDVDFTALLTDGTAYTVKITEGAGLGRYAQVNSWTANELTLEAGIGAAAGSKYEIRQSQTVGSLFGLMNEAGLTAGTQDTADVLWIPNGAGGFTRIYFNGTQWKEVAVFLGTRENVVIPADDAIFVQSRAGAPLDVVFVGHVETAASSFDVGAGFNFLSRVLPVGVQLGESMLAATLTTGPQATADIVWNPDGAGGYTRYYHNGTDWKEVNVFLGTRDTVELESGYILQRQTGGDGVITAEIPASLDI